MTSNNTKRKTKQTIALFVTTFLITLIGVTYLIKSFSPNVDVEIGGEDQQIDDQSDTAGDFKKAVDDRLKWIQLEDNMPGVSKRVDENASEEEISYESDIKNEHVKPSQKETNHYQEGEEIIYNHERAQQNTEVRQSVAPPVPAPKLAPAEPLKMSKVYVGHYATIEQAIQAQNKLMNTSIGISPFVKEVSGSYVLQAGSFASIQKAESVANQIIGAGFSARVVAE